MCILILKNQKIELTLIYLEVKFFVHFQSGGECLRSYVSVGPDQICRFTDPEGKSGLWYMVQVAGHMLNPVGSEFSATFVGIYSISFVIFFKTKL